MYAKVHINKIKCWKTSKYNMKDDLLINIVWTEKHQKTHDNTVTHLSRVTKVNFENRFKNVVFFLHFIVTQDNFKKPGIYKSRYAKNIPKEVY